MINFDQFLTPNHILSISKKYIEELERLCIEKQLRFPPPKAPYDRRYFIIEGASSVILGFFTAPNPERDYDNLAWNRISNNDFINLRTWNQTKQEGKKTRCLIVQIWKFPDNSKIAVIIPLDELEKLPSFITGDFTVKMENYNFYLKGDENKILLKTGIDRVLDYL